MTMWLWALTYSNTLKKNKPSENYNLDFDREGYQVICAATGKKIVNIAEEVIYLIEGEIVRHGNFKLRFVYPIFARGNFKNLHRIPSVSP